jgi:hypothetical protein
VSNQNAALDFFVTPPERVTACLIVQEEEVRLPDALRSVAFCDEIIVVDGGSRDRTVELAREAGAKVIENPWPGYARQRNVALEAATTEWILEIDADERVGERLAESIRAFLADPPADVRVCVFALRNRFIGAMLGPSAKYPQYRFRLFRREGYFHDERLPVHEGLPANGGVVLDGELVHELADSLQEAARDVWRYAGLQSQYVSKPRSPVRYAVGIAVRPATKLVYRLALEGGWRDGWRGALKIGLDCASDSLVWVFVLLRDSRVPAAGGEDDAARRAIGNGDASSHFGAGWGAEEGPVKIVAVASGSSSTSSAAEWLAAMSADGAEVALITDQPGPELEGVRLRHISHLGPIEILRALEAERQLLSIDALVAVGGLRTRLFTRLMPRRLRGMVDGLDVSQSSAEALERCARTREQERAGAPR